MQVACLLNCPVVNAYFYSHIIKYCEKTNLKKNLATSLKFKLSEKVERFNTIDEGIEMLKNS